MAIKEDSKSTMPEHLFTPRGTKRTRSFETLINSVAVSVVATLVVVVFLTYLTNIMIGSNMTFRDITTQALWLYFCTMGVHLLLRNYALRKGRATTEWQTACKKFMDGADKIAEKKWLASTSIYCREWERDEYILTVTKILESVGITYKAFDTYYKKETKERLYEIANEEDEKKRALTKRQVKGILKAQRIKPLHCNERRLTSDSESGGKRQALLGGITTSQINKIQIAQKFLTSAIACLFGVSISLEITQAPTLVTFLTALIKTMILVIFGAIGVANGYIFAKVKEVEEWTRKANEQQRFMEWRERNSARLDAEEKSQAQAFEKELENSKAEKLAREQAEMEKARREAFEKLLLQKNAVECPTIDEKAKTEEILKEDKKTHQSEKESVLEGVENIDTIKRKENENTKLS